MAQSGGSVQGGSFEQQQIVREFQQMRAECNEISQKISELEVDKNEHRWVMAQLFLLLTPSAGW